MCIRDSFRDFAVRAHGQYGQIAAHGAHGGGQAAHGVGQLCAGEGFAPGAGIARHRERPALFLPLQVQAAAIGAHDTHQFLFHSFHLFQAQGQPAFARQEVYKRQPGTWAVFRVTPISSSAFEFTTQAWPQARTISTGWRVLTLSLIHI